jgi:hypothetical protein
MHISMFFIYKAIVHNDYKKKLARSFNFTFLYIDDVLSLNNSRFGDFVARNKGYHIYR